MHKISTENFSQQDKFLRLRRILARCLMSPERCHSKQTVSRSRNIFRRNGNTTKQILSPYICDACALPRNNIWAFNIYFAVANEELRKVFFVVLFFSAFNVFFMKRHKLIRFISFATDIMEREMFSSSYKQCFTWIPSLSWVTSWVRPLVMWRFIHVWLRSFF